MADRTTLKQRATRVIVGGVKRAFARAVLIDGFHDVIALSGSKEDHSVAFHAKEAFGKLPKEQDRLFNSLAGPAPLGILVWATFPNQGARLTKAFRAVIRQAAFGEAISPSHFVSDQVGLTVFPEVWIQQWLVDRDSKRAGRKGPADAEGAARLPAIPDLWKGTAEEAAFLLDAEMAAYASDPVRAFTKVAGVLDVLHEPIARRLQTFLAGLEGKSLASFEANHEFVAGLNEILRRLHLRVECTRCKAPATLVLIKGETRNGAFNFRHTSADAGRTTHGGKTTIPPLRLVAAEP